MTTTTQPNPFVGPRSFETGEKLYGRDRELRVLSALLIAERIVLMHSPSGAGKTSLLKAGLLPKLREDDFNVLPVVRVNIEPPKEVGKANRYLISTLLSLEEGFPQAERLPLSELAGLSLEQYLDKRTPAKDTMLVLDQFEEVLTTASSDHDGKLEFFNQLGDALRNKSRWALFSMREDYLGMLAPYLRPIPNRLVTRFRLDLLSADAAILAMQLPAKATGVNFTEAAARQLADDLRSIQVQLPDGTFEKQLGPYVEPVQLQVVCYRLWESLKPEDRQIDESDLAKVGDVNESLADYYAQCITKVTQSTGTSERTIREWFDHKLITPDGLRGQVRQGADASDGLPNADVRLLEDAHIIRAEQRAEQTWIELAHDRLVEPVRANNHKWLADNLILFQRQAEVWLEKGRSDGLLLRGAELEQAEKEAAGLRLTPDEESYLSACRQLRRRAKRDRILRQGITAGLVASIILFIVAVYFGIEATNANKGLARAANTAQAASTQAIFERANAQAASTQAIAQQALAQAASTQAIAQQALAQSASTQAVSSAYAASTAMAQAESEKARAQAQELIAQEQKRQAQASALVAQSLLQQLKVKDTLANLLAVEAFHISDLTRTRIQMLTDVYLRGRLPLFQTNSTGITPGVGFTNGDIGMVSSNYIGCEKDNIFLCDSGVLKLWSIKRDTRAGSNAPISLSQSINAINPPGSLDAFAVSPDGLSLATAACTPASENPRNCSLENILLWDPQTRQNIGKPMRFVGDIANDKNVLLSFSPDGKTLALALNLPTIFNTFSAPKPTLILWDLVAFKQKGQITPDNGLTQMTFSPDGKTLALASGRGVVLVDMASQQSSDLAIASGPRALLSLAYSQDGKYLAIGNDLGTITLLDLVANQVDDQPMTNISKVEALGFSPDGKILAAGYADAGVILWDVDGRQRLVPQPMYKHVENPDPYPIFSLAFSPDGKMLATTSNEIILWDTDTASWVTKACIIAGRNFSKAEWQQFFPDEAYRTTCPQFAAGR
jgi:WD40 repeat protein